MNNAFSYIYCIILFFQAVEFSLEMFVVHFLMNLDNSSTLRKLLSELYKMITNILNIDAADQIKVLAKIMSYLSGIFNLLRGQCKFQDIFGDI